MKIAPTAVSTLPRVPLARAIQAMPALGIVVLLAACQPPSPTDRGAVATDVAVPMQAPPQRPADGPSFDCREVVGEDERLICDDPGLAALDRRLDAAYREALEAAGDGRDTLKATQIGWLKGRGDCWKAEDKVNCVREAYLTRLVDLQINSGAVVVPTPVEYRCDDDGKPFTATFYNDLDPRAAVLTWGNDQAIVFARPAASGTRYGREGLDFREHQGEVRVDFHGNALVCRPAD
ncbi:MliC family protein [Marilutibacter maris]|uniref:C-type lysozyme inhibitor domain-containing protein n=1 Tax=Marilutibacter maris TaxID=1605891 RepID=A0A2U9TER3_9GAMM|nr:MliC family protein [Lysobacter maris]AWV08109.1 hypothetical protein C9I47_2431 [Lysobacter maris]